MKSFWFVCLVCCLGAASVSAQEQSAPSEAVKAEASAHFRQGGELFKEGAYRAALVELQRAHELLPDYRVLYNIGQTQLQLGEYVEAIKAFEAYLVQGGSAVDPQRRQDTEKDLAMLRKRVATLAITVNVAGADVLVDSTNVGKSPLNATIPVSVGRHRVFAQGQDGTTSSVVIEVAGGDLKEVALELVPKTSTAEPAPAVPLQVAAESEGLSKRKKWAIGLLSAGAAVGIGAGITGLLTRSAHQDYIDELEKEPGSKSDINAARDDMKLRGYITDGLAVCALGLGIASVVLFVTDDGEAAPTSAKVELSLLPNGLSARGEF